MTDFEALVRSVGEMIVDTIGRDRVRYVDVVGDGRTETAEIAIGLLDVSWQSQSAAIDKMIEIRRMYLGELAISYHFIGADVQAKYEPENTLQLSFV